MSAMDGSIPVPLSFHRHSDDSVSVAVFAASFDLHARREPGVPADLLFTFHRMPCVVHEIEKHFFHGIGIYSRAQGAQRESLRQSQAAGLELRGQQSDAGTDHVVDVHDGSLGVSGFAGEHAHMVDDVHHAVGLFHDAFDVPPESNPPWPPCPGPWHRRLNSAIPRTPTRGWFNSCAIPAAISPRDRSRSDRILRVRCFSSLLSASRRFFISSFNCRFLKNSRFCCRSDSANCLSSARFWLLNLMRSPIPARMTTAREPRPEEEVPQDGVFPVFFLFHPGKKVQRHFFDLHAG